MARGTEDDGWRYVDVRKGSSPHISTALTLLFLQEEAGVTFYRKEIEGPGGKHGIYKGVVVIGALLMMQVAGEYLISSHCMSRSDATAKSVFDTINKADRWPKWDRTLSKVQVLDRLDQKNEIVHMHVRKFFPSISSFAQAVNMSKRGRGPSFIGICCTAGSPLRLRCQPRRSAIWWCSSRGAYRSATLTFSISGKCICLSTSLFDHL
jgi:hypothetical protein